MIIEKVQEKVQMVTNVVTPAGATTAGIGMLTLNDWLVVGGFILALGSFLVNWYYQHKRFAVYKKSKEEQNG